MELPQEEYDTIGGFVVELLGHLPREGEHPTITYKKRTVYGRIDERQPYCNLTG